MVVSHHQVRTSTWRPVPAPTGKKDSNLLFVRNPPMAPPKPNGKFYVYTYEQPTNGHSPLTYSQARKFPPHTQFVVRQQQSTNGPSYNFPCANEVVETNGRQTPEVRLKERYKRNEKGYKVIADVSPKLRSSSKGGKMFIRQKKRMDQYTSAGSKGKRSEDPEDNVPVGVEERATPWNLACESGQSVRYIPAHVYHNQMTKEVTEKGSILPPVSNPNFIERAEVEDLPEVVHLGPPRRWNIYDAQIAPSRCGSAPPMFHDYDDEYDTDYNCFAKPINGCKSGSRFGVPTSTITFNARRHGEAPHWRQGMFKNRSVFVTQPHAHLDFNARPVGWSRSFAEHY
ncbi:uncharacterized protein LOC100181543 [Ciona intestinalis]